MYILTNSRSRVGYLVQLFLNHFCESVLPVHWRIFTKSNYCLLTSLYLIHMWRNLPSHCEVTIPSRVWGATQTVKISSEPVDQGEGNINDDSASLSNIIVSTWKLWPSFELNRIETSPRHTPTHFRSPKTESLQIADVEATTERFNEYAYTPSGLYRRCVHQAPHFSTALLLCHMCVASDLNCYVDAYGESKREVPAGSTSTVTKILLTLANGKTNLVVTTFFRIFRIFSCRMWQSFFMVKSHFEAINYIFLVTSETFYSKHQLNACYVTRNKLYFSQLVLHKGPRRWVKIEYMTKIRFPAPKWHKGAGPFLTVFDHKQCGSFWFIHDEKGFHKLVSLPRGITKKVYMTNVSAVKKRSYDWQLHLEGSSTMDALIFFNSASLDTSLFLSPTPLSLFISAIPPSFSRPHLFPSLAHSIASLRVSLRLLFWEKLVWPLPSSWRCLSI